MSRGCVGIPGSAFFGARVVRQGLSGMSVTPVNRLHEAALRLEWHLRSCSKPADSALRVKEELFEIATLTKATAGREASLSGAVIPGSSLTPQNVPMLRILARVVPEPGTLLLPGLGMGDLASPIGLPPRELRRRPHPQPVNRTRGRDKRALRPGGRAGRLFWGLGSGVETLMAGRIHCFGVAREIPPRAKPG